MCFFNLLRCFGLRCSRKHLIFLLVAPPPQSPESSTRGAGALTCFLALIVLHVAHTHTLPSTPKMFYFPASLSKAAFHRCACLCCPSSRCSMHPAQELQPAGICAAPAAPGIGVSPKLGIKAMCIKVFISLRDELLKLHKYIGFPFHSVCLCRVDLRHATSTIMQFLELGIEAQQCQ